MKKLLVIFAVGLLSPVCSFAADYYISNTAKGSHDCSSWENSCTPKDVTWGGEHINLWVDGANFYFDGGSTGITYYSPSISSYSGGSGVDGASWKTGINFATGAKSPFPSGHDGYVIFDGQGTGGSFIKIMNVSHVTIDGEKHGTINWKFYNMVTHGVNPGDYPTAIYIGDSGGFLTSYPTVKYVWVDTAASGIKVLFNRNVDIHHNKLTNIYHETAIDARGFKSAAFGTNIVHHNEVENAYDPVAWSADGRHGGCGSATNYGPDAIQASGNVDIYNNTFTSRSGATWHCQHPDAIQADWDNMRVYNNRFLGGPSLFQNSHERTSTSNVNNLWVYNNVMIAYSNGMQFLLGGYKTAVINNVYLFNNTALNMGQSGFTIPGTSAVLTNVQVKNNIFHAAAWNDGGSANEVTAAQCAAITYSNNVVNGTSLTCGGNAVKNANGQTGMPKFMAYTEKNPASDVHLAVGDTVAIDRGISLSSYFSSDKDGILRPQGAAWDIGAYESTGEFSGKIPNYPMPSVK